MIEAPKEIWISPTNYRWWTSPCEDLPLLHRYIHAAESKEAADRIEQLEREAQLQAKEIDKTRRRADEWQSMVIDCEEYLKPGETPRQRMDRDHADVLGLMKLLEKEKRKSEQLVAERDAAYKRGMEDAAKVVAELSLMAEAGYNVTIYSALAAIRAQIQERDE